MRLLPTSILRSSLIIGETKNTYTVSTLFIASFAGAGEKTLSSVKKVQKSLVKMCEIGIDNITYLERDECALYHRDWSNVVEGKNNMEYCYPL